MTVTAEIEPIDIDQKLADITQQLESGELRKKALLKEIVKTASGSPVTKTYRPFISTEGRLCVFRRGARRYGRPFYPSHDTLDVFLNVPVARKSVKQKWRDSWLRVCDRLRASGLWPELLETFTLGLTIGHDKICQANAVYWDKYETKDAEVAKIDERLLTDGSPRTDIIWRMSDPAKVKKMYFGSSDERIVTDIARHMRLSMDYSASARSSYDVSFEYKAALRSAWYSEEFKGCGNGHYYLALDSTHALFYEND